MQIFINIVLYAVLLYWLYESIADKDYWYTFVVGFVVLVSIVMTLLPRFHASKVSPGEYPYED
ncbi:MAG TPA: hypothetical protein VMC85_03980 [Desulfomonilaceae bacterium]|nr:hypothetical protein [Desulfomonilaceae bacterium]